MPENAFNRIIVIGASAGGFEAIQSIVAALPPTLPASIFIVWHMSPDIKGVLPHVLNKLNTLPAANAYDGERIQPGRIYVAPPDRHLLLEDGILRVTRGPKENRFRPAVDPLFRSAAYSYGPNVIGIVLSGGLDDGTSGLWMVKHRGGTAIVQEPYDAAVASMPESALRQVAVDYRVPVAEMPALLEQLCALPAANSENISIPMEEQNKTEQELQIAKGENLDPSTVLQLGQPSPFACPECHGVLITLHDGKRKRYRCHTGHAYSADSLLSSVTEAIDDSLWNAIRGVEESLMLLNHMGDHYAEANQTDVAARYFQKAKEADVRLKVLKELLATQEQLSKGKIE